MQTAASLSIVPVPASPNIRKRHLHLIGGAFICLLLAATGAFLLLTSNSVSPANLRAATQRFLLANSDFEKSRYCLKNFAYAKDLILVANYDPRTKQWMSTRVSAGLCSASESVNDCHRPTVAGSLRYVNTDAGKKAAADGSLCVASGFFEHSHNPFQQHS